jgi:PASTA domain
MILEPPFIKKNVVPGEPVTAQAWNDIVNSMSAVYGYLETTEATTLRVQIANSAIDLATVRVTAVREDGTSAEAVRPVAPGTQHVLSGLRPGSYSVHAEAPGFDPASLDVTVPISAVQNVTLTKKGAFMPAVFGKDLQEALAELKALSIIVGRVIDVTGSDVPVANPGAEFATSKVLIQLPSSGASVTPGETVQLVISASLKVDSAVELPPLTGLTLSEAQKALESLGLVLGKVVTKQKGG